jgi:hypothetical protein
MAAFEKTLFPGLKPEQYRIVWIEHRDKENTETGNKRLELNFLIPNVEITTGKRLQPFFAKADLNRVDDFKTIINHKYQLFDPDDPINRRSVKIAKNLPQDKKDFISAMNTEVALAITEGLVSDRESLKAWMTDIGLEITRITKNQISVKNPNNPDSKAIPLKGEFYEQNFRHSEKAQSLREKHQNDIDEKLTADMQTALNDTKSFVNQRVNIISNDMQREIEQTQQNLQDNLQSKKTSIQANINTMGENLNKDTQAMQESLQMQIQSMKKDLQTLNGLSQATAEQAKLKKALFSSNIVLVSIALILLISSICLGYVSKSKYNDISEMQNKVEYLKSQGGSMNIQKCGTEKDWRWCVQIDPTVKNYKNNFAVVQETN